MTDNQKLKRKNYIPYPGFYDLRIFDLNPKQFNAAWRVQDYLYSVSQQQCYYKQYAPHQWEEIKELASLFLMYLLPLLKKGETLR